MGEIRTYKCSCGYKERISVGTGLKSLSDASAISAFPELADRIRKERESGNIKNLLTEKIPGICEHCRNIQAVFQLTLEYSDGNREQYHGSCTKCNNPLSLYSAEDAIPCPVCGQGMGMGNAGLWD